MKRWRVPGGFRQTMSVPALALAVLLLGGCANFRAASEFAAETGKLTATVRSEFRQLDELCTKTAELEIVVNDIADDAPDSPLKGCAAYQAAQGRLAEVTIDTLDAYAKTLAALADGKALDLGPEIGKTTAKLGALERPGGKALLDDDEVSALTKILKRLEDVVTRQQRAQGLQALVEVTPELALDGRLLRAFFARDPRAPHPAVEPRYGVAVADMGARLGDVQQALAKPVFVRAEPLRTRELRLATRPLAAQIKARDPANPKGVPAKVTAAIDAWLEALDAFAAEALQSEPERLLRRLRALREKASDARDAIRAEAG